MDYLFPNQMNSRLLRNDRSTKYFLERFPGSEALFVLQSTESSMCSETTSNDYV